MTLTFVLLAGLVVAVACVAIRDAVRWYGRPIAGVLVDPGGAVSALGLEDWAGKKAGLRFPDQVYTLGSENAPGNRSRTRAWDEAVANAQERGYLDAVVERDGVRHIERLPVHPLPALAWWIYAGSFLLSGLVYASAGLLALWASPRGELARAFAKFAITTGLYLCCFFNANSERTLTPVLFTCFTILPVSIFMLMLKLPDTVGWLKRAPWIGTAMEGSGWLLGLTLAGSYLLDRSTLGLQTFATLLLALGLIAAVAGFLFRYARSRSEQRESLRVLLLSMVPPYAAVAFYVALASVGMLGRFPDEIVFPALLLAPLASLHAFVRYDLWGSRALLSRIGTNLFLGTLACALAIAAGGALAAWMGASFRDALAGAAGGGVAAVGSSRVDLQACKLEYSIVSPK